MLSWLSMVDFVPFLCPQREREREREGEKERLVWWGRGKKEVFIGGRVEP
jgi:hypothetical protein